MSRVCYAFQRGDCTRGTDCRFAHTAAGEEGGFSGGGGGYRSAPRNYGDRNGGGGGGGNFSSFGAKTGVCYAFQRGECTRGESCRYSHAAEGAGGGGGFGGSSGGGFGGSSGGYNSSPRPTGVCYAFQRGECERGDSCRYAHDNTPRAPRAATGVCYAFQRGECTRGESCRYAHEEQESAPVEN